MVRSMLSSAWARSLCLVTPGLGTLVMLCLTRVLLTRAMNPFARSETMASLGLAALIAGRSATYGAWMSIRESNLRVPTARMLTARKRWSILHLDNPCRKGNLGDLSRCQPTEVFSFASYALAPLKRRQSEDDDRPDSTSEARTNTVTRSNAVRFDA
jgi:hypothetical protein